MILKVQILWGYNVFKKCENVSCIEDRFCILLLYMYISCYFCEFCESEPRENFHFNLCLFIVLKTFSKIAKLSPREFPHLVQNRENICTWKLWRIQYKRGADMYGCLVPYLIQKTIIQKPHSPFENLNMQDWFWPPSFFPWKMSPKQEHFSKPAYIVQSIFACNSILYLFVKDFACFVYYQELLWVTS